MHKAVKDISDRMCAVTTNEKSIRQAIAEVEY